MGWFDSTPKRGFGHGVSPELAEALGCFDVATGLRRKADGSLEILYPADTPADKKKVQRHIQVEEVDSKIVLIQQDGQRLTFPDAATARAHLNEQLGEGINFQKNGSGFLASRCE